MPLSKYDIVLDLERTPNTSHAYLVRLVGAGKRVLDVGCDTGYLGTELAKQGNTVHGFEIDEVTAAKARESLASVEVGDLEATDLAERFGEGKFDVVVFGDVLEHLRDPDPVLRRARRLLAPGGSILISTPNIAHGDIRLALLSGRFSYTELGILDNTHTRFFTRESLVDFVHRCGFRVVELHRTVLPLFGTEVRLDRADYDPALVAQLADDIEATTYQFVIRVVPDDMTDVESHQALMLDELNTALRKARHELLIARDEAVGASGTAELLRNRVAELEKDLAAAAAQRKQVQQRLDQVLASTSWRVGNGLVRRAARLRGKR